MTQSDLYTIIVRDKTFCLDRSQIEFDSPNYFTACFLGSFSESSSRKIHLSRDPVLFAMIVNYLSGYTILPIQRVEGMSEEAVLENLSRDAMFYGLEQLIEALERHRMGIAMRTVEERVEKNYMMVVWPQGMGSRKKPYSLRITEAQAQAQCNAHPISPSSVPMLRSVGSALVSQHFQELEIESQTWTWAAFWTTPRQGNQPGLIRVENDCAVLEIMEVNRDY